MNKKKRLSILAIGISVAMICFIFFLQLDKENMKQIECSVAMPPNKELLGEIIMESDNVKLLAVRIDQISRQKQKQLNQAEEDENNLFEGFSEMKYTMLLETNTGFDVSLDYYRYGLYDNSVKSRREGEELYFALHEKIFGKTLDLAKKLAEDNKNDKWITHKSWLDNSEEIITDFSTDMEWMITREYQFNILYRERWYNNREQIKLFNGSTEYDLRKFVQYKTKEDCYEPILQKNMESAEQLLKQYYGNNICERSENWWCFDTEGKLLAITDKDEHQNGCGTGITIYSIEEENAKKLYYLERTGDKTKWPIEISQMEGDRNSGWIIFSQGDETYKITYPNGEIEKLGEFMYGTTYSPDGKYLAYCTGNIELFWMWESMGEDPAYIDLKSRWIEIPAGWYVEELETGKETYIPMPVWDSNFMPLYGGRCVWIEKAKLYEILNS